MRSTPSSASCATTTPTSWWWATPTSPSTPSAAPASATSWSSRTTSPRRPPSCSSRTTARPRTSSPRPTPSSAATRAARTRTSGRPRATARRSSATWATTSATRRSSWPTRSTASPIPATPRRPTSRCSTAPTHRAVCSRKCSSGSGLPYRVVGGVRFYERKEVKDALAYVRVLVNPLDAVSLRRILNEPKRGIGDRAQAAIERARRRGRTSRSGRRCSVPRSPAISPPARCQRCRPSRR